MKAVIGPGWHALGHVPVPEPVTWAMLASVDPGLRGGKEFSKEGQMLLPGGFARWCEPWLAAPPKLPALPSAAKPQ